MTFESGTANDGTAPTVSSTSPINKATGVFINQTVNAAFSEGMDSATFTTSTFTLKAGTTLVSGTVTYVGMAGTFTPSSNLATSTLFTATITTGVKDLAGNALTADSVWEFTTGTEVAPNPTVVDLGTAGNFVILAKSGINTVPTCAVIGDMGVSPISSTAITGFSLTLDGSTQFSTSSQVTGKIFAANYTAPTPANLTTAISNMETAYTDAAGRAPDVSELGAGTLTSQPLVPGVYKWSTKVNIPTDLTLSGGPNDVWIFMISGDVTMAAAKNVVLSGGALPKNIFWQVAGGAGVTLGANTHFEGVVLAKTAINFGNGASVNGRLLSQTAVNIDGPTVTQPAQ